MPQAGRSEGERAASRRLRTDRIERLVGEAALERLRSAHVLVVGVGGVGSYAVEALGRSGIGRFTLIDGERISATNLNRQLHALEATLGRPKVEVMAERLRAIDPSIDVEPVFEFYGEQTADRLVPAAGIDFVIDAIDNVTAKLHLLARCRAARQPIVASMGAAGRLDPTQIRSGDLCETTQDHFARDVRKFLRRRHGIDCKRPTGIWAVWSSEPGRKPLDLAADARFGVPDINLDTPGIRGPKLQGSAVFVTAAMGMAAASVAVRELLRAPPVGAAVSDQAPSGSSSPSALGSGGHGRGAPSPA